MAHLDKVEELRVLKQRMAVLKTEKFQAMTALLYEAIVNHCSNERVRLKFVSSIMTKAANCRVDELDYPLLKLRKTGKITEATSEELYRLKDTKNVIEVFENDILFYQFKNEYVVGLVEQRGFVSAGYFVIRTAPNALLPQYLWAVLQTPEISEYFKMLNHTLTITNEDIKNCRIAMPDLQMQQQFYQNYLDCLMTSEVNEIGLGY